jgi:cell division topological specificity factor
MSLVDRIFGTKQTSASKAKDRLSIMLAHERAENSFPFLDDMRNDIIEVIKKYTSVDNVSIKTEQNQNIDILEVEITLSK